MQKKRNLWPPRGGARTWCASEPSVPGGATLSSALVVSKDPAACSLPQREGQPAAEGQPSSAADARGGWRTARSRTCRGPPRCAAAQPCGQARTRPLSPTAHSPAAAPRTRPQPAVSPPSPGTHESLVTKDMPSLSWPVTIRRGVKPLIMPSLTAIRLYQYEYRCVRCAAWQAAAHGRSGIFAEFPAMATNGARVLLASGRVAQAVAFLLEHDLPPRGCG